MCVCLITFIHSLTSTASLLLLPARERRPPGVEDLAAAVVPGGESVNLKGCRLNCKVKGARRCGVGPWYVA